MEKKLLKDRAVTEKKILDAVGEIIAEDGFEKVGVNLVAQKAGISKMLIYRYFGDIDTLIAKYILQEDFWINIPINQPKINDIGDYAKKMFRDQITQLRENNTLKRLYRWELSTNNPVTAQLREKREKNGCQLVEFVNQLTKAPQKEVAALASILSASISYLALLEELNPVYNGIDLRSDKGWDEIANCIDLVIDLWIKNINK